MAKISITVNTITEEKSFPSDAKASAALNLFYTNQALGPESATNRQKLAAILVWFARYVQDKAYLAHVESKRVTEEAEAKTLYQLEDEPATP